VLNSVNVSAALVKRNTRSSRTANLSKVAELLLERGGDPGFLAADDKGRQIPTYLKGLSEVLVQEQRSNLRELDSLSRNIEHINEIVASQQNYARLIGPAEKVMAHELVEDAIALNASELARHGINLVRSYGPETPLVIEKHKVIQILVNLIQNAINACKESGRAYKKIEFEISRPAPERLRIRVIDNGIGIQAEHLPRMFTHGFTTRKNGHGFGLHSGINSARSIGSDLTAHSDGPGQGAVFSLEVPIEPQKPA
jgi:signal transduction histidine kinase